MDCAGTIFRHGWRVQIIVEVGIDPSCYSEGEYQRLVRAPSVCPNCGRAQALEAHGYYRRWVAGLCSLLVLIAVRRFVCRHCLVTVSCLPQFAQPYRLVCNETIEAFFAGKKGRPDVERWRELLGTYRRRYEGFLPELRAACGALFGRSPPQEEASAFWRRIMKACGGLAAATGRLVHALESRFSGVIALTSVGIHHDCRRRQRVPQSGCRVPTQPVYGTACGVGQMLGSVMENDPNVTLQEPALVRHNAVSWIQQALNQGHTLGRALALASQLDWGGRHYSPRSLEGWFYEYRAAGFAALVRQRRSDKGQVRAFSPEAVQAIIKLRLAQPALPVTALIRQLLTRGVLEPGTFSMPSVYRVLRREGLDRPRLLAETHGPAKAFECELPNMLWMTDIMDGPALREGSRGLRTFLFATLDDCSRLVPHAQYYPSEKLRCLLDCLRQAFACRGLPEKLYTDQGKVFTGSHLRLVCANLQIALLHARPYAAWSKGKIERFFQTVQADFQARLRLDPVENLEALNNRFWHRLEVEYHRRTHSALGGQSPSEVFARKTAGLRQLPDDWQRLFLARATRRVRLDATISLEGRLWEVPVHLRGRPVELRYEPFDWSRVEVWHRDSFAALARPCDKHLNAKTYTAADYEP